MSKLGVVKAVALALAVGACGDKTKTEETTPMAEANACAEYGQPTGAEKWMAWEDGVDIGGMTEPGLPMPNVIVHVAKSVATPAGTAPSGMIFYQPDPQGAPLVMGFVSTDATVASYFGPNIFAGTPFEQAPALTGTIEVTEANGKITSRTEVGGHVFETEMTAASTAPIDRPVGALPFTQKGTEAAVSDVVVKVDGTPVQMEVLPQGIAGGPGAVYAPCGVYAR